MNTTDISNVMKHIKCFRGVFAADQMSHETENILRPTTPSGIIVNTDPSWRDGQHWVAFYFNQTSTHLNIEYFDSFGSNSSARFLNSKYFKHFVHNLREKHQINKIKIWVNKDRFQDARSSVCGQYCCFYIYFRCKFNNMAETLTTHFTPGEKYSFNDCKVLELYRILVQRRKKIQSKHDLQILNQKCSTLCKLKQKKIL